MYSVAYAPFGETYAEKGSVDRFFTGNTQDAVKGSTGLYDFLFRQNSAAQGRWLVPDPAGLAAVDITNPQTWNRYAYVGNDPLRNVDPMGLYCGYLNQWGTAVETNGIDDNSSLGECNATGGYWIEGSYGGGSWVQANPDSGLVTGLGFDSHGDREISVAGAIDSNGIGTNPIIGASTITFSASLNIPVNVMNWAAQQTIPVHGLWTYKNWAGAGGLGFPMNQTDANALMHDYCYAQGGFTSLSNYGHPNAALQACNQALCDAERSRLRSLSDQWTANGGYWPSQDQEYEWQAAADINAWFSLFVMPGNTCH